MHEEAFIVIVKVPNSMNTAQVKTELEHSIEFGSVIVKPFYVLYGPEAVPDNPSDTTYNVRSGRPTSDVPDPD